MGNNCCAVQEKDSETQITISNFDYLLKIDPYSDHTLTLERQEDKLLQ